MTNKIICVYASIYILICMVASSATGSPSESETASPLLPATPDVLTSLRAAERIEKLNYQLVETDQGSVPIADGLSTHDSAIRAVQAAFRVPVCEEVLYGNQAVEVRKAQLRFTFAVEANERLVDALDKLTATTDGLVQWRMLDGRILLIRHDPLSGPDLDIMDWPVDVDVNAETLLGALQQIEAAFNQQYPDSAPLLVRSMYVQLDLSGPAEDPGQTGTFLLRSKSTLREAVLAVLDRMQDPAVCYMLVASTDQQGRMHFALWLTKDDAPQWNTYASGEEMSKHQELMAEGRDRLEGYFSDREKAAGEKR
ncbi:MAG TPA: hypothetical protein PLO37_14535 [Candidatus Hydrogenedentes bacterium]|nr:hypothetical protein [Candidatus Hydrogenedentota bacterium]HPG68064.1 hypothetical protein [Candidatus Hydrogenedentota bacterium]